MLWQVFATLACKEVSTTNKFNNMQKKTSMLPYCSIQTFVKSVVG